MIGSLLVIVGMMQVAGEPPNLAVPLIPLRAEEHSAGPFVTGGYLRQGGNGYQVGAGWLRDGARMQALWLALPQGMHELQLTHWQTLVESEYQRFNRTLGVTFQLAAGKTGFRGGALLGLDGEWYLGQGIAVRLAGSASVFLLGNAQRFSLRPQFDIEPSLLLEIIWYPVEGFAVRVGYDLLRQRLVFAGDLFF